VTRYYHILAALSVDTVPLVRHVLHNETGPKSYDRLRASLLALHSLFNYQKMKSMMRLPPLGDHKPSVMLAEMLEFCPAGKSPRRYSHFSTCNGFLGRFECCCLRTTLQT
jgi:hypothetical protein